MWLCSYTVFVLLFACSNGMDLLRSCSEIKINDCLLKMVSGLGTPPFCADPIPVTLDEVTIKKNLVFHLPYFNSTVICKESKIYGLEHSKIVTLEYEYKDGFVLAIDHPKVNLRCKYESLLYQNKRTMFRGQSKGSFYYGPLTTTIQMPVSRDGTGIDWNTVYFFTYANDTTTSFKFDDSYYILKNHYPEVATVVKEMRENPLILKRELIGEAGKIFTQQFLANALCMYKMDYGYFN